MACSERHHLRDPHAGQTGSEHGGDIRHHQARGRHDRNDLAPSPELPGEGTSGRRVLIVDARVLQEIARIGRSPMRLHVAGRGDRQDAGLQQFAGREAADRGIAEAQRHVEAVRDEIADVVAHDEFEPEVPVLGQESGQFAREHEAREEGVDVDAQPSPHPPARARRVQGGLLDAVEMRTDTLPKAPPLVAEAQRAGGSVEKPNPDPRLQPRDGAAHA